VDRSVRVLDAPFAPIVANRGYLPLLNLGFIQFAKYSKSRQSFYVPGFGSFGLPLLSRYRTAPVVDARRPGLLHMITSAGDLFKRRAAKKTAPVTARVCAVIVEDTHSRGKCETCAQRHLTTSRRAEQINLRLWAASVGCLLHSRYAGRAERPRHSSPGLLLRLYQFKRKRREVRSVSRLSWRPLSFQTKCAMSAYDAVDGSSTGT
jgi:hypothetical protein